MASVFEVIRALHYVQDRYPNADAEFQQKKIRKCLEIFEGEDDEGEM
ncbi:MAG: hypothetical protein Q7R52_00225 [archaeon]|nr:hypothetical protein [archaeon]